jgi:signal transduction histidine kinase
MHPEHLKPSLLPQLLTLLTGVLIVGLGAMVIARSVGKPLQQLSQAARAFGAGDLRARAATPSNDDLGAVLATFNEMADRIQQLVAAEKELIANVAHELRTPLARIRVALELAAEGDAKVARASISEIAVDLAELETLVNDVLNTSRFEATAVAAAPAGFALHIERVAPAQIAEQAVERFRTRHPERKLSAQVAPELPELEGDPNLVRRVLDNVLENAHKYSHDPASEVVLKVSSGPNTIRFEVEDHGVGIAAEDLPRVFTAFFRAERSRSRRTGGVGLGLTLAKRIVEAHGGSISIESELGHGTCVRVELPFAIDQGGGAPGGGPSGKQTKPLSPSGIFLQVPVMLLPPKSTEQASPSARFRQASIATCGGLSRA